MVKTAPHVFTYIYSLLIEQDICDRQNVSIKLLCICVCRSPRDLLIFSFHIFALSVQWYFPFHMDSKIYDRDVPTSQKHLSVERREMLLCMYCYGQGKFCGIVAQQKRRGYGLVQFIIYDSNLHKKQAKPQISLLQFAL